MSRGTADFNQSIEMDQLTWTDTGSLPIKPHRSEYCHSHGAVAIIHKIRGTAKNKRSSIKESDTAILVLQIKAHTVAW